MTCRHKTDPLDRRRCIECRPKMGRPLTAREAVDSLLVATSAVKRPTLGGFYWARSDAHRTIFDLIVYLGTERNKGWMVINVVLGTINYYDTCPAAIAFGESIAYPRVPEVAVS